MTTPSSRTFTHAAIILGVGLFALGAVSLIPPLRSLERQAVKTLAVSVQPVDTLIDGAGSQKEPWTRRQVTPPVVPVPPRFLAIDDDPEGWFSTSPLSPVDHALIFARLREAGHHVIGVGNLMAWDEPESLAIGALRKQLDKFDAAVLALPLARGAAGEPLPAPFVRMSIADSAVKGNLASLPQVNRVAIPNAELGGKQTLAGFSILENEPDPGDNHQHLLARWDDRVLFAFPLATEIAGLGLTPDDVQIKVGKEIRLGTRGPVIPIDEFGRTPVATNVRETDIPAMRLISEKSPAPPTDHPLLTRDVREELPEAEKAWSGRLGAAVQALRSAPSYDPPVLLARPNALLELLLILVLALFATWSTRMRRPGWRIVTALGVIGVSVEILYLMAARQNAWLPPLAMMAPGLTAFGLAFTRDRSEPQAESPVQPVVETPAEAPAPTAEAAPVEPLPEIPAEPVAADAEVPAPAKKTAARKTARKAAKKAAKKAPAKKAAKKAAKKTTAKKAARKTAKNPDDAE
ncbi:hypothetical protein [Luteolibacter marinus]|uniref:hypothetical protein n=1 Tax=Luteolibacter marinus TaxID=2776705 RepID=UPI001867BA60|nr:hypothetical protein [Luteolibacter marinus]